MLCLLRPIDRWIGPNKVLNSWGGVGSVRWPLSTPFPLSEVLPLRAMRLYTDGKRALLGKSMGIEIGGAHDGRNSTWASARSTLTVLAPAPTFNPSVIRPSGATTLSVNPVDFPPHRWGAPVGNEDSHLVAMAPGFATKPVASLFFFQFTFFQFTVVRLSH